MVTFFIMASYKLFRADKSIYHALGYGVFMYLKAMMTFEQVNWMIEGEISVVIVTNLPETH